ncbi:MAG: dTDP-glucose 4,6-dehydratase [Planctomycetota bacterium]
MTAAPQTLLVTGGAGFIGSNLVRMLLAETDARVVNLDLLTYAGRLESLGVVQDHPRHEFVHGDIADAALVGELLRSRRPAAVLHLAAESHVDRSIEGPAPFITTNVLGTGALLNACLEYWSEAAAGERGRFRFLHVSTDEVYGSLTAAAAPFTETSRYDPSSPYAASKAGSDHLVRAFARTYGLPAIVTNASNNYGPYQFPEKLIPLMTLRALAGLPLPLYGDGLQVRDWLHVKDQCRALITVLRLGQPGGSYNIGAGAERTNRQVVESICQAVDGIVEGRRDGETKKLIRLVADRPGHDRRYAIDATRVRGLGWRPSESFEEGVSRTVRWYADNEAWVAAATRGFDLGRRAGLGPNSGAAPSASGG